MRPRVVWSAEPNAFVRRYLCDKRERQHIAEGLSNGLEQVRRGWPRAGKGRRLPPKRAVAGCTGRTILHDADSATRDAALCKVPVLVPVGVCLPLSNRPGFGSTHGAYANDRSVVGKIKQLPSIRPGRFLLDSMQGKARKQMKKRVRCARAFPRPAKAWRGAVHAKCPCPCACLCVCVGGVEGEIPETHR